MKTTIDMAREVKATAYTNRHYPDRTTYTFGPEQLKAFESLVRADEREQALAAQPAPVPLTDDPLQGAVDWFLQADGEYFCTANVQRTLRIGYNRAKRLCDTAKERAAHGITEKGQP
jgi:DNA segregation ATPase FtsK/SpoIIIE-like protein